jgi:hypothetical protein
MPQDNNPTFDLDAAYKAFKLCSKVHATHRPSGATLIGRIYNIQITRDHERVWVMSDDGEELWADLCDIRPAVSNETD